MAIFNYTGRDAEGNKVSHSIDALTRREAFEKLRREGIYPLTLIESVATEKAFSSADLQQKISYHTRLSASQLITFTEELSELLDAGLQLEPALRVIEQRQERSPLRGVAAYLRQQVRDGVSFSRALKSYGKVFSDLYSNMVAAGEASGTLPQILRKQCEYLSMMDSLQRRVTSALIYPSIVFASAILLMFIFLTFLVPQLTNLLSKTGQQLPLVTRMLVATSNFSLHWWWAILIIGALIIFGFRKFIRTSAGRIWWHRVLLKAPIIGPVVRARFLAQLLQTLSTLVANGVTLLQGILLMRDAIPNIQLKELLGKVGELVGEGGHFSHAIKKVGFFPPMLIDILAVGEQTGDIAGALERAARKYDRELTTRIQHITTLIQPIIILFIAAFVGIVAYSMIAGILTSVNALRPR